MVLGIKKLHELVKEINLVENLCERELNNPEGAGFDLRLAEVYGLSGDGFLGVEERETPKSNLLAAHNPNKPETENYFIFEPSKYYLIKTMEKINLPLNLSGIIFTRTTLFRSGLNLLNGNVAPGYKGELTFGLANFGSGKIKIFFGARVAHITFHEVLGEGNEYRGQWKGGRVSTDKKEVRV